MEHALDSEVNGIAGATAAANFSEQQTEQIGVQIGLYLIWLIENGLYAEYFEREATTGHLHFKSKPITFSMLAELWNGYVAFEFLKARGDNFTYFYYTSGLYVQDYEEIMARDFSIVYCVDEKTPEYGKLKERINFRYAEWHKIKTRLKHIDPAMPRNNTPPGPAD